jgi:hypothetical protein
MSEEQRRLYQDYIAPKESDTAWADATILGLPARLNRSVDLLKQQCEALEAHGRLVLLDSASDMAAARALGMQVAQGSVLS